MRHTASDTGVHAVPRQALPFSQRKGCDKHRYIARATLLPGGVRGALQPRPDVYVHLILQQAQRMPQAKKLRCVIVRQRQKLRPVPEDDAGANARTAADAPHSLGTHDLRKLPAGGDGLVLQTGNSRH